METPKTYYELLEVSETASPDVIRAAYRSLIQKWNPDNNPAVKEQYKRISDLLNEANTVLSDAELRRDYDERISAQRTSESNQVTPTQLATHVPDPTQIPVASVLTAATERGLGYRANLCGHG